jgi:hypothetical protein
MKLFGKKKTAESKPIVVTEPVSENLKAIIEGINCPYQILEQPTGEELMKIYVDAYLKGRLAGYVPVLVGDDDILAETIVDMKRMPEYQLDNILKEAGEMDGKQLLKENLEEYLEDMEADEDLEGEMEGGEPCDQFLSMVDYRTGGIGTVALLKLPTENPWETVAYVPFGGWNECPSPEDMTAICKYWFEKYQAVPAAITHDTLEFLVPKPVPAEEAMETAKEHFAFCTDRVFQGTHSNTVGEVADCLRQSKTWYFWWD